MATAGNTPHTLKHIFRFIEREKQGGTFIIAIRTLTVGYVDRN